MTFISGGGADGSIAIFPEVETAFHANIGLDEVVATQKPFLERSNMTVADLYVLSAQWLGELRSLVRSIQFAGAVGISNCPGAPPLNAFIGKNISTSNRVYTNTSYNRPRRR